MRVLVCANAIGGHMDLFSRQLSNAGITLQWGAKPGEFSWRKRLEWFRDVLREAPNQEEKVVLSDGWDVVFQGSAEELERRIPDNAVLIAGEKNCWPDPGKQIEYPMGPTPWMFVNAGGIAGKVKHLHDWIAYGFEQAKVRPELLEDDQRFWTHLFLSKYFEHVEGRPLIFIDYHCSIFQTVFLAASNELLFTGGRVTNTRTGTTPFFLHWNGGQNWPAEILTRLGMV